MKISVALTAVALLVIAGGQARAFSTPGFQNPYGIVADPKTNFLYISNTNGAADACDNNGFISRLKGDGSVDQLRFIDGAASGVELNAPKGMALVASTLYVADLDKLRAFDVATGKPLFDVNFGDLPVQHFYGIALGPDESLYLTDGPANVIYRIDIPRLHEVTTFSSGDGLGQPHGICWYGARQLFVVGGWSSGQVIAFDRSGKRQPLPAVLVRTPEGIAADGADNLYIASPSLAAVFRLASNFGISSFGLGINTPAGVAFHPGGKEIVITSLEGNTVQSLPAP